MAITIGAGSRRASSDAEPTRGSRYQRGAPEEDAAPARRGRRTSSEEPTRGRSSSRTSSRSRTDDDEPRTSRGRSRGGDDAPRREAAPARQAQRGWAGSKRTREETSDYGDRYKLIIDDWDLIAFGEDEPFDSAPRHFIQDTAYKGQRSFICPGKKGPYECPLCGTGDKPMPVDYFNIAVFDVDEKSETFGEATMKVWEAGPGYSSEIETQQDSRAVDGHLSSVYFEIRGKKQGASRATKLEMNVVRERDLVKEWKIDPLSEDDWKELEKDFKDDTYVEFSPKRVLQEAADKLLALGD